MKKYEWPKKRYTQKKKETQADSCHNHSTQCESSVRFSHSVVSDSLWPHGLQHARPPCPSSAPGVYSSSCPLSRWCHPTISSSVVPFSSCLHSFPALGSFCLVWMEMTKMLVSLASWVADVPSMQMHHFFFFFLETVHSIALLSRFLFVLGSTSRLWVLSQKRILSTLTIALLTNCRSHSSDYWNINFFERWEWIWRSVSGIDGCSARLHSLWTIQQRLVSTSRNASWCWAWWFLVFLWDIIYLGQLR